MTVPAAADPALTAALSELTALGLRMARVVTEVAEAEQRTVAVSASWLPEMGAAAASLEDATRLGQGIDTSNDALALGVPRVAALSAAFERVSRSVRRTVALARRLDQGWPPQRSADTSRAMLLRQAARGVGDVIRAHTHGDREAAERLFADLATRLADPAFEKMVMDRPVEEVVQLLCRELKLPDETILSGSGRSHPGRRRKDPD